MHGNGSLRHRFLVAAWPGVRVDRATVTCVCATSAATYASPVCTRVLYRVAGKMFREQILGQSWVEGSFENKIKIKFFPQKTRTCIYGAMSPLPRVFSQGSSLWVLPSPTATSWITVRPFFGISLHACCSRPSRDLNFNFSCVLLFSDISRGDLVRVIPNGCCRFAEAALTLLHEYGAGAEESLSAATCRSAW